MSTPNPEDLRQLLWETASRGDAEGLESLCRASQDLIREAFPRWRQVPSALRDQPAQAEGYIQAMAAVARVFDQRLKDPRLLKQLTGEDAGNPLNKWQASLDRIQQEMDTLHFADSASRLNDLLIDVHSFRGTGADNLLSITYGLLGECYFQNGKADQAVSPMQQAIELCYQLNNQDGITTYLENLFEIHRYRADIDSAVSTANELVNVYEEAEKSEDANIWRRKGERVSRGEPLVRAVCNVDGKQRELEEILESVPGRVEFGLARNRLTLRSAHARTTQGDRLASQDRLESALGHYADAARMDPYDPQCHYAAGMVNLHRGRFGAAVEEFRETERLAPGWFDCRSLLWIASGMHAGNISKDLFESWQRLEKANLDPAEKLAGVEKELQKFPSFAPLLSLKGRLLRRLKRESEAKEAFRAALVEVQDNDLKSRLLVDLAILADRDESALLLKEAIRLDGNTIASAMARWRLAAHEKSGGSR